MATVQVNRDKFNGVTALKIDMHAIYDVDKHCFHTKARLRMAFNGKGEIKMVVNVPDYLRVDVNGSIGNLYCARAEVYGAIRSAVVSNAKCTGKVGSVTCEVHVYNGKKLPCAVITDDAHKIMTLAEIIKLYEINEHAESDEHKIERATVVHIDGNINELLVEHCSDEPIMDGEYCEYKHPEYFLTDVVVKGSVANAVCYGTLGVAGPIGKIAGVHCLCLTEEPKKVRYIAEGSIQERYPTNSEYEAGFIPALWAIQNNFPWDVKDERRYVKEHGYSCMTIGLKR